VGLIAALGTQEMEKFDEQTGASRSTETVSRELPSAPSGHRVPCNDVTGRVRPISAQEQARKAQAIAAFVDLMLAMPDDDPPGAWEEAMRDLDAHRPHRKLFEGLY
jgi:hypothetical protein